MTAYRLSDDPEYVLSWLEHQINSDTWCPMSKTVINFQMDMTDDERAATFQHLIENGYLRDLAQEVPGVVDSNSDIQMYRLTENKPW